MMESTLNVYLAGNPNSGKSSLFNALTGLKQQTSNYPGVTVDSVSGFHKSGLKVNDLPGSYGMNPDSDEEQMASEIIRELQGSDNSIVVYVADASNLRRSLYYFSEIQELGIPIILCLNMNDIATLHGISIDRNILQTAIKSSVIAINAKNEENIEPLVEAIGKTIEAERSESFIESAPNRFYEISKIVASCQTIKLSTVETTSDKIDKYLLHPVLGYFIFFGVLMVMFQSIFSWSELPMELIESGFSWVSGTIGNILPDGYIKSFLIDGLIAGIAGIAVFVPQIAFLFLFVAALEDSGYMARVSFLMDKLMRKIGLNRKSVIPLMGGLACAIPAIMSARTINNPKERFITIMVTPLMSCSARLPIYTLIISLVIPSKQVFGILNLQGITMFALYMLGILSVVIVSVIINKFSNKERENNLFYMEIPTYKIPLIKGVLLSIWTKVKIFLFDAGKIIIGISIILWFLASFGPGDSFQLIENKYTESELISNLSKDEIEAKIAAEKLEHSYAGMMGKLIEPVIRPLGFNWKIGIALITSFAAREVFVGTISTIYSVGDTDDTYRIKDKLAKSRNPITGHPEYTLAVGISLLIFYAFAMQCMSTLAIVKRETNSWKWPIVQFVYMTTMAYVFSAIAFTILS